MQSENERDTLQPRAGTAGVYDAPTLTVDPTSEQIATLLAQARAADAHAERIGASTGVTATPVPWRAAKAAVDVPSEPALGPWFRPAVGVVVAAWVIAMVVLWLA